MRRQGTNERSSVHGSPRKVQSAVASKVRPKTAPESDGFYTIPDMARLTGIPARTLHEWRLRGIITPNWVVTEGKRYEEGYSYAQLTIVRLIRQLRADQIDFKAAAKALRHLYDRLGPPSTGWRDERVYFIGKDIYVEGQDGWPITEATQLGQTVATPLFGDLFEELRDLEDGGSILIPREFRPFVEINPAVMGGEPVIRGTRIPTSVIAAFRKKGRTLARLVELYAPLTLLFLEKAIDYEGFLDQQSARTQSTPA